MKTHLSNYELTTPNGTNKPTPPCFQLNGDMSAVRGYFMRLVTTLVLITVRLLSGAEAQAQNNVGIGTTTPNPKAVLELQATDKGLLTPRLTQAQMNAIVAPPNGLLVYNTTKNCFYYFDNVSNTWKDMCSIGATGKDTIVLNLVQIDSLISHLIKTDSVFSQTIITNYLKADSLYAHFGRFDSIYVNGQNITTYLNSIISSKDTVVIKYLQTDSIYSVLIKADSAFIQNILTTTLTTQNLTTNILYANYAQMDSLQIGGKNITTIISDSIAAQAWLTKGNIATNNYKLGTRNARDLHIIANNLERITVANGTGNVGIGQTLPSQKLDILGNQTTTGFVEFGKELKPAGLPGNNGEVLTSTGIGTAPVWKPVSTILITNNTTNLNVINVDSSITNVSTTNISNVNILNVDTSVTNVSTTNISNVNILNVDTSITNVSNVNILKADTATLNVLNIGGQNIMTTITDSIKAQAWLLKGNAGTNPVTNFIGTINAQDFVTRTNNTEKMRVTTAGNIGIGTSTPAQKLDVVGNIKFTGALMPNNLAGTAGQVLTSAGVGTPTWTTPAPPTTTVSNTLTGSNLTTTVNGVTGVAIDLSTIVPSSTTTNTLTNTTNTITSTVNSIVATAPAVNTVSNTSTANNLITTVNGVAGTAVPMVNTISNTLTGSNLTTTVNGITGAAINLSTLPASSNAWNILGNTGTTAGTNFLGTTDNQNVVFKRNNVKSGLLAQTTTAFGVGSFLTSTANANTAIGGDALALNTTGTGNTAIGESALYVNTVGNDNTALGYLAGDNTGSNTSGIGNTLLGAYADVQTGNLTNATAIGYKSMVGASNSMVLGGTGLDAVKVGIGTITPKATLEVKGSVALNESPALTLANGANNDITIGAYSYARITGPTGAFAISGLTAGTDGRLLTLHNTTTQIMTIENTATSAVANQINTLTGANIVTPAGPNVVQLQYNATLAKWIIIGGQNITVTSGGGGGSSHCYTCDGF